MAATSQPWPADRSIQATFNQFASNSVPNTAGLSLLELLDGALQLLLLKLAGDVASHMSDRSRIME